jgi:hypothetical protein
LTGHFPVAKVKPFSLEHHFLRDQFVSRRLASRQLYQLTTTVSKPICSARSQSNVQHRGIRLRNPDLYDASGKAEVLKAWLVRTKLASTQVCCLEGAQTRKESTTPARSMAKKLATIHPSFCPSTQTKACNQTLQFPYRSFAWRIGFERSSLVKSEMPIWHAEHLPFSSENCRLTMHENSRIFSLWLLKSADNEISLHWATGRLAALSLPVVIHYHETLERRKIHLIDMVVAFTRIACLAFVRNSLALDPSYSFLHLIHISFWETGRRDRGATMIHIIVYV